MDELDALEKSSEKLYAEQALFYLGTVTIAGTTNCRVSLDSVPGKPVINCTKLSSMSVSANNRVIVISISGTYFVLARIT